MGRPRLHDERTREALLAASERLIANGGVNAVGVRPVAEAAGTTTRAVYALFGSKEGLVQAVARRAFELVMQEVAAVPLTGDPGEDLVACAALGFRRFALEHPDLFLLFFTAQRRRGWQPSADAEATRLAALDQLILRVERARAAGLLGGHSVEEVTLLWDAMCSGLATREICGPIERSAGERIWRDALGALLAGLGRTEAKRARATA